MKRSTLSLLTRHKSDPSSDNWAPPHRWQAPASPGGATQLNQRLLILLAAVTSQAKCLQEVCINTDLTRDLAPRGRQRLIKDSCLAFCHNFVFWVTHVLSKAAGGSAFITFFSALSWLCASQKRPFPGCEWPRRSTMSWESWSTWPGSLGMWRLSAAKATITITWRISLYASSFVLFRNHNLTWA